MAAKTALRAYDGQGGPKIAQELAKWTQDRPQRTQVKAMLTQEKLKQAQDSSKRAQSKVQAQAVSLIRAAGVVHDVDPLGVRHFWRPEVDFDLAWPVKARSEAETSVSNRSRSPPKKRPQELEFEF